MSALQKLQQINADLWQYHSIGNCNRVIAITTNGSLVRGQFAVAGAGCNEEAAKRYPNWTSMLGAWVNRNQTRACYFPSVHLIAFPVKYEYWQKASMEIIRNSMGEISNLADVNGWQEVYIPRPGCGHGHLRWEDVAEVVYSVIGEDRRFIFVDFQAGQAHD